MFSFNVGKCVFFDYKQSSKKITYLLPNMYTTYDFLFCLKVKISTNYK